MAVQVSYPGVYIDEFTPGAPIQGIGTSTAVFLGPSADGPLNEPTKITSWRQFVSIFGSSPLDGFYLWYGVRGFFENGGTVCYVVRVSNADYGFRDLADQSAGGVPTIRVRARTPGSASSSINVTVEGDKHAVSKATASVFQTTATVVNASGNTIDVTDPAQAANFRSGDTITIEGTSERVHVLRVQGPTIRLTDLLSTSYNGGETVRLADLLPTDTVFRAQNAAKLGAGSVIKLEQAPAAVAVRVVKRVDVERISPALTTYRVTLRQGLGQDFDMSGANAITIESQEFKLIVTDGPVTTAYDQLGMDPEHINYYSRVIRQDTGGLIYADPVEPPNTTLPPDNRPASAAGALSAGTDDDPATLTSADYQKALALIEPIREIDIVAIPGVTDPSTQMALIDHCTNLGTRFAVLDSERGAPMFGPTGVEVQRSGLDTARGFAALYYPWLQVPAAGKTLTLVPPSGHVAGIYARTDNNRGVHKAPAGTEAIVNGALGVEQAMNDNDQGQLNLEGINCIRVFNTGGRPVVWGARTTATDTNWQYVNIRRLFLFLEGSIEQGIRWAVFEPNNLQLWQKLKRTISEFLTRVWRDGALFGATAEEAFYVRIDEVLNPFTEQALGRLNIEIGVRPSYPAEFIVLRIGIWQGGSEVTEG